MTPDIIKSKVTGAARAVSDLAAEIRERNADRFEPFPALPVYDVNCYKGRGGYKIDTIVIHVTYGSFMSVVYTFREEGTSSHIINDRDGQLYRMVPDEDRARTCQQPLEWHPMRRSLNVENIYEDGDQITDAQYDSMRWLLNSYWSPLWGIPIRLAPGNPYRPLSLAQLKAFGDSGGGVIGHCALTSKRIGDPPDDFKWERILP